MKNSFVLKYLLFACFLVCGCLPAFGQSKIDVKGKLIDESNGDPIIGAVVEYVSSNGGQKRYVSSDKTGGFTLPALTAGAYDLRITYLGMKPYTANVEVSKKNSDLGTITMQIDVKQIDEVVVEGITMRTTQKGDTLVYNAGAFKVAQDATTEQLLSKMPGIKVDGGTVEAQGEEVKKLLVDGKEFFGDDVTTAIRNLPAEVIDKVEVLDKQSDQAEFSGVDDGESYKAINVVTHGGIDHAQFGRFYAGYGFNDLYNISASLNLFKENRRLTLLGMANNVNQQNFGIDDLMGVIGSGGGRRGGPGGMMVGNQSGVSTVQSFGINYANQWRDEKIRVEASYLFNTSKNITESLTEREYFSDQFYDERARDDSKNFNHRINGRVEYKIDSNNTIMFRPTLRFQTNDAFSSDTSSTSMTSSAENALLNVFRSTNDADAFGYSLSGSLIYMHKFGGRDGRVLMMSVDGGLSKNDQDNTQYSLTRYLNPDSTSLLNQYIMNHSSGYNVSGRISYSEPISDHVQLLANYQISYNYSDRDKRSYELPGDLFLDSLSNTYNSGYLIHRVGPGLRYHTERTMFVTNINYQRSTLTGDQVFPTSAKDQMDASFNNVVYMAMLQMRFNPSNMLRIRMNSRTSNPSVTQLQNVLDVSNPLFISQGNPHLQPVYSNNMNIHYRRVDVQKGRTFMVMLNGSTQSNYIANSVERASANGYEVKDDAGNTIVTLDQGAQYSRPVNLDGYWNVSGGVSYGLPVKWLMSNLNFDARVSYNATPTIYNLVQSTTTTTSYTGGITIGSNIDKLDFSFSYNAGYNIAHSTSNNEYFNGVGTGRIVWETWKGITLRANGSYMKYRGVTDKFTEEYFLLNASIGKKIFKNQRGEINVQVNDILNQNKSFSRIVSENYIQNVTSNVLGRYVCISFVYNLKNFTGKDGRRYSQPPEGSDFRSRPPHEGGRPMGPPPGRPMPF